jgi:hypothetical protein
MFGHAAEIDGDLEAALRRANVQAWPDAEKEAEAFGAWFLMPRHLMKRGLGELGISKPCDPLDVYALSLWLGTSYTATARQLAVTRLAGATEVDEWVKVQPRTLKEALAGELTPDDMRNDVWWLDARHNRNPIDARPGDRLVLTLDEIPSTGYSWRFSDLPADVRVLADSYEDTWEPELTHPASTEEELVGGGHPRSMVLEIDPEAGGSVERLGMIKDQEWNPEPPSDEFELLVSITPPLTGVQVPEAELALRR